MPEDADDEINLFRRLMRDVKPLNAKKIKFQPRQKPPLKPQTLSNFAPLEKKSLFNFSNTNHVESVNGDTYLLFTRNGLQHRLIKHLRQGQLPIEAILDLHGHTVEEARMELAKFLEACVNHKLRVVQIIHGKGRSKTEFPILKNRINNWLREYPLVLAFCSARQKEGGLGAVYVLLRKKSIAKPSDSK